MASYVKRKKNTVWKVIVIVLLSLLLVGALFGVVSAFSSTSTPLTFSLKCDGRKLQPSTPLKIVKDNVYKIDVVDPLGNLLSDGSYTVKVVANTTDNKNIYWRVANVNRTLSDLPDVTEYLLQERGDDYFILKVSSDFPEMLQDIYGELEVTQAPSFDVIDKPMFNLVVSSATGSFSITVPLQIALRSISLDVTHYDF